MPQVKKTLIKLIKDVMSKLYMERSIRPILEDQGFVPGQADQVDLTPDSKPTKRMVVGAYLDKVDWNDRTAQVQLAAVLDEVLVKRNMVDYRDELNEDDTKDLLERTATIARQCGYIFGSGNITVEQTSLTNDATASNVFDIPSIRTEFNRMREHVTTDGNQAITSALCLLESVCKHLLDNKKQEYDKNASVTELMKDVIELYQLNSGPLGEQTKHFLRASAHQIAEARRIFGTAHGHGSSSPAPQVPFDKGELVIDLCYTVAKYLLQAELNVQ